MPVDPRTPVIVGAGQHVHRAEGLDDALEPIELMATAVRAAAADAGLTSVPRRVDSIRVVSCLSWRYRNPAWVLAERMAIESGELAYTTGGGQTPQALVSRTALDIVTGHADIAILVGGEAWRTRMRARHAGAHLDWAKAPEEAAPVMIGDELDMTHAAEAERGLMLPIQMYPLFETAIRAAAGRDPGDHAGRIAELWSRFSAVAAGNPYAWIPEKLTAAEIAAPSERNRMVGLPYTKVMNANNDVDMAAALIICSAERAAALGVGRDRWVFPHAGTDCNEHQYVSNRWWIADTPAIRVGGRRVLDLADVGIDDVGLVDLYSCFPSAVQLGAASLGLDLDRQLTRTGGLSFAGGPWNNYVMHAIATITGELRDEPGGRALVWATGGYVTKHSFGVYAADPPASGFRHDRPQAEIDALPARGVAGGEDAAGRATIEAYTVMHDRTGAQEVAIAACVGDDGRRSWAVSGDHDTMAALTDGEWVGTRVDIDSGGRLQS